MSTSPIRLNCRARRLARSLWSVVAGGFLALAVTGLGWGQPAANSPEQPDAPTRLGVHRIYVPADEPTKWPTGGETYLPIDAAELAELLAAANGENGEPPYVASSLLHATMRPDGVLAGRGLIRVEMLGGEAGWLALPPTQAHLEEPAWLSPAAEAQMGYRGSTEGIGLRVTSPGRLSFDWELSPQEATSDYKLRWPSSSVTTLVLDLPPDVRCEVAPNSGMLVLEESDSDLPAAEEWPTELWPPPLAGTKRWLLTSAPSGELTWQLRRKTPALAASGPKAECYEEVTFEVAENGTRVRHRLHFEGATRPTTPPAWNVPQDLVITSAKWGSRELTWTRDPMSDAVVFELTDAGGDAPLPDGPIEIEAWGATELDEQWRLPTLEPQGVSWLYGRAIVEIAPELEVRDVMGSNVRQSSGSATDDPTRLVFEKLRGNGAITLQLGRRIDLPTVRVGRWIELDGVTATARMSIMVETHPQQPVHHLQALIEEGWDIQSVVARGPYDEGDWYAPGVNSPGPRRLTVPVAANPDAQGNETMILDIGARRTAPGAAFGDHAILAIEGAKVVENYVTFAATDPFRLEYPGNPPAVPTEQLSNLLGVLLPETVSGPVFDMRAVPPQGVIRLGQPPAAFDAHVTLQLEEEEASTWRRTGRVRVVPQEGLVDRLELELSGSLDQPLRWRLDNENEWQELETSPVATDGSEKVQGVLLLPQPTSTPLTIHFDVGDVVADRWEVEPIRVINAQTTTMICEFRTAAPTKLGIDGAGFSLVAPQEVGVSEGLPLHSRWQLDVEAAQASLVVARRDAVALPPRAQVVEAQLNSWYAPRAMSRHLYRLTIVNHGETRFACELPALAENVRAWRGETPTELLHPKTTQFELPLTGADGKVVYHVAYALPAERLESGHRLAAPWPELNLPVVSSAWVCEVPHELRLITTVPQESVRSWQQRLLGILAFGEYPWLLDSNLPRWQSVRIPAPAQLPLEIRLVSTTHRTTQCLWLLAVSLVSAHFCVRRWPTATVIVAGVAAALSVLLSGAWSLYAAAVSVGMWFGIFVTALSLIVARIARPMPRRRGARVATTAVVALLATGLLLAAAGPAQSQEPPATEPDLEALLIPVDPQGREVGERHYVTPRLLRELSQRRDARQARGAWIVTSGVTDGELVVASEGGGLVPGVWTFTYDLETFRQDVAVELPLVESQGVWTTTASVDGIAIPLVWNPEGRGCRLQISEPGEYRVRVTATPKRTTQAGKGGVRLDVPSLPEAELRLTVPAAATGIDVNGRPLPPATEMQRARVMRLPMEGKIVVRWPQPDVGPVLTDLQATELTWMEIGEDAIEVQSVFHVRSAGLLPATLELQSSEPARLITDDGTSSMVGPVENRWTLAVEPLEGLPNEGEVRVHLRLARDHVLGRIPFPQFGLSATNVVERKFAGSATESLSLTLDVDTPAALAIDPLEFSYDWPDRLPPVIAVQQMESAAGPVIAVRPARDETSPEETVEVGCFDESFRIAYEGIIPRSLQDRWQHSLRVTPGLVIDKVSMTVGPQQNPLPLGVSRPQPDKLVVFFSAPIQGSYRLAISAHLPRNDEEGDARLLPTVTSYANPPSMQRMELFSGHGWRIDLPSTDVRPLNEAPATSSAGWDAYPVGTYQLATQRGAPLEVEIAPNRPVTTLRTITSMVPAATGWVAEVEGVVEVEGGTLWELQLEMPEAFLQKAEIEPPVSLVVGPRSEGGRQMGTLRWGKVASSGDRLTFTLRGAVRPNARQQFEIPALRGVGVARVDRLLALPVVQPSVGLWENLGPRVADRPTWLEGVAEVEVETQLYRLPRGNRAGPRLVTLEPDSAVVAVAPLMETQLWFAPQQGGIIRTSVTLPSLVAEEIVVEVPKGQQLLWLSVDRRAVVLEPRPAGYALRLPSGARPHGLEVVTRLDREVPTSGAVTIASPRLLVEGREMAVAQRLWSYDDVAGLTIAPPGGGEAMSELDQAAVRLNQLLATLLNEGDGTAVVPDGANLVWFDYWIAVLEHARLGLQQAMERPRAGRDAVVSDQPTNAEFEVLLTRATSHLADLQGAAPPRIGEATAGDPWLGADPTSTPRFWRPLGAPPQASEVTLHLTGEIRGVSRERWIAALGLLGVAGVLALMTRQRRPLWQNEQVLLGLLLLAGGAWWLWLPLGWIGLVMAIGAGVAWLRYLRVANASRGG